MYLFDGTMAMDIVEQPSTTVVDKLTRFNHTHQTKNTYSPGINIKFSSLIIVLILMMICL